MNRRIVLSALSLPICLLLCGCLVMHDNQEKTTGKYVSETTMAQIQPGKTTAGWVKSILGEPSAVDKVDSNSEIWKYSYTEQKESNGAVFLIFAGTTKKEKKGTAFVEFKDGVVTNHWRG